MNQNIVFQTIGLQNSISQLERGGFFLILRHLLKKLI